MRLLSLAAAASLLAVSLVARADTSFDFNATFQDGSVGSGGFSVNTATGQIDSINIFVTQVGGNRFNFSSFTQNTFNASNGNNYVEFSSFTNSVNLFIAFPEATLVGYAGGELCDLTSNCVRDSSGGALASAYAQSNFQPAVTGFATVSAPAVAATPEPSSLALLGTSLVGVVGMLRKRLA